MNALIVAGGTVDSQQLKDICLASDTIIALDRGLDYLQEIGVSPDILLGDMDSVTSDIPSRLSKQTFPSAKGFSDLEAGLIYAQSLDYDLLQVLGAFGTRIDHLLSGLSLLLEARGHVHFLDTHNRIRLLHEKIALKKSDYIFFSVQALTPSTLSIKGAKYELDHHLLLPSGSLGLSNEWKEPVVHITLHEGKAFLIESRD
mgnify:CR=1 FL=1